MSYEVSVPEVSFVRTCINLSLSCITLLIYRQNPFTAVERQDALALLIRSCSSTAAFFAVIKSVHQTRSADDLSSRDQYDTVCQWVAGIYMARREAFHLPDHDDDTVLRWRDYGSLSQ